MPRVRAERDEECWCCGYPFDLGEWTYQPSGDELGPVYCGERCYEEHLRMEEQRQKSQWIHNPAN